ncbi:hypothetical protein GCM10020369_73300 [Cryptosporangium minutisporangium]|uniref:Uncharacterized protein n=1 Tax=Cryptosporangium minutisporangium TaxID=113569 RepID=A0ABP6TAS0_9ACTN
MVALAIGVLLGAVFTHGYEARLDELERRDALALVARVAEATPGGGRVTWAATVVVANPGPSDVRVRAARLGGDRFRSRLRGSRGVVVPAGAEVRVVLEVSGGCAAGGPRTVPGTLVATVTTARRGVRRYSAPLADDAGQLLAAARRTCADTDFDRWVSTVAAGAPSVTRRGLVQPVRFLLHGSSPQEIGAVRSETPGLVVVAAPLPVRFTDGLTPVTTLRWAPSDCLEARRAPDDEVRLRATVTLASGPPAEVTTLLDAESLRAVSTFRAQACA